RPVPPSPSIRSCCWSPLKVPCAGGNNVRGVRDEKTWWVREGAHPLFDVALDGVERLGRLPREERSRPNAGVTLELEDKRRRRHAPSVRDGSKRNRRRIEAGGREHRARRIGRGKRKRIGALRNRYAHVRMCADRAV